MVKSLIAIIIAASLFSGCDNPINTKPPIPDYKCESCKSGCCE